MSVVTGIRVTHKLFHTLGGPLSISQEVAAAFNLTGIRDVCIRRVDKHLVALDLVEFRFQVCVT